MITVMTCLRAVNVIELFTHIGASFRRLLENGQVYLRMGSKENLDVICAILFFTCGFYVVCYKYTT